MRKILLAAVAVGGLLGLGSTSVSAAPVTTGIHTLPTAHVANVDYYWDHRHYHHRRWRHGHWHYY